MSSIKHTKSHDNVPATAHQKPAAAAHGKSDAAHSHRMGLIANVHGKETSQQARIDQGVKSGELTKAEAKKLEKQQKHIENLVKKDAKGGLTKAEAKEIKREQAKASEEIYLEKHNDQVTNGAPKMGVNSRWERQSDRIQNGIDSGQITGKEADKLTKIEAKIQAKEQLAGIDGKLSRKDRLEIEHLQDKASKLIYNAKHNKAAEPFANSTQPADTGTTTTAPADTAAASTDTSTAADSTSTDASTAAASTSTDTSTAAASTSSGGLLGDLEKLIGDGVGAVENLADGLIGKVGDGVKSMADGLVSKIGDSIEGAVDGLIGKALQGLESIPLIGGLIKDFEPAITGMADGLVHNLVGGVENMVDGLISKGVDAAENAAKGLVTDLGNGITNFLDGEIGKLGGLLGGLFG